jgi:hypothetical protein
MAPTKSVFSIGELADRSRVPLRHLEAVIRRLKIAAALRINGIDHYDEADCDRIVALLLPNWPKLSDLHPKPKARK